MVVFEGQLKHGPTPRDTYYDEVDLTPHLKKGRGIGLITSKPLVNKQKNKL